MAAYHGHCNNCVSLYCDIEASSESSCSVVSCPNCSIRLHECKLSEHIACTCPESPVPCINHQYGCEVLLRRCLLGTHLKSCPASVLLCRFVRQRWQLDYKLRPLDSHSSTSLPDQSLLQRDLQIISGETPEVVGGERKAEDKPFDSEKTSLWCTVGNEYFINPEKYCKVSTDHYRLTLSDYNSAQYYCRKGDSAKLCHSFLCGTLLRREQYQSHVFNHQSLDVDFLSLKISRCPLLAYGCQYGVQTHEPSSGRIDYNTFMLSFTVTNEVLLDEPSVSGSCIMEGLPVEVLLDIIGYLDSLSLWNLSQVSRHFRELCERFLDTKGVVYFIWEKADEGSGKRWYPGRKVSIQWKTISLYFFLILTSKRWTFPKTFPPIHLWEPKPVVTINEHLLNCPYNIKNNHRHQKNEQRPY